MTLVVVLAIHTFCKLRRQHLSVLLTVELVLDRLEERPKLVVQGGQLLVLGAELSVEPLQIAHIKAALCAGFQVLIGANGRVQLFQNTSVIHQHAIPLGVVQAVHACNRLDQVVPLQRLVDVKHRVARFVKTRQQLVHHNQQVGCTVCAKVGHRLFLISFCIVAVGGHGLLPPLLHFGQRVFVHFRIAFACVGGRNHHRTRHQPRIVQGFFVTDRIELAVGRHLTLES